MNDKYKKLIVKLLDMASQEFSFHGCNDLPSGFFNDWSTEEMKVLVKDLHVFNCDSDNYDENNLYISDWNLMGYMATLLPNETETVELDDDELEACLVRIRREVDMNITSVPASSQEENRKLLHDFCDSLGNGDELAYKDQGKLIDKFLKGNFGEYL